MRGSHLSHTYHDFQFFHPLGVLCYEFLAHKFFACLYVILCHVKPTLIWKIVSIEIGRSQPQPFDVWRRQRGRIIAHVLGVARCGRYQFITSLMRGIRRLLNLLYFQTCTPIESLGRMDLSQRARELVF